MSQSIEASKASSVGFLLLDNFSLTCFAQCLDVLMTANLIQPGSIKVHTFSRNDCEVISDLAIPIRPDTPLTDIRIAALDLMVVCGGLRTPRVVPEGLTKLLNKLASMPIVLGGLWNGAWYLGKAGLLDGYRCAIHAEQRIALSEFSPNTTVTLDTGVFDRDRLTASNPAGAFQIMMKWLYAALDPKVADAVFDLLDYHQSRLRTSAKVQGRNVTAPLQEIIKLMECNVEEPLGLDLLAECVRLSKRQIQRLFREQINTSPQRYYLELRLREARRLIQNSKLSVTDVAIACGFVSTPHFSKCYSTFFDCPPSKENRYEI
ncbi:GlxA family transcriptional regulator [Pseudomonas brassicacearum]|uniref:GlxA family transcriptional regulator n=1 Tax=Pseudomonas brassicacearum TaxID=930166 RepID=UPI001D9C6BA0|nr:helix-turn-helix domain-containing protein [Pseudomonas brassicacearum]CAH0168356.1 HTH-type transcriptional regulator CdhR [Pseudomonas brassicacearum]